MNKIVKGFIIIAVFSFATSLVLNSFSTDPKLQSSEVPYSTFLDMVELENVSEVQIEGSEINFVDAGASDKFTTFAPFDPDLIKMLREKKTIRIVVIPVQENSFLLDLIISWFPMLLLVGVWIYFMRKMQRGGGPMGIGNAKTHQLVRSKDNVTFADVAGVKESEEELREIVDFLRDPTKFNRLGSKIPRGCLLVGAPGTGKTLLGKAIAGEAGVPFFSISGSEFVEMFVGVGASRVRDLFAQAKRNKPCIVFIDEIDAVGRHRGAGLGGGNDEREQTLNQLLVELDGFEKNEGVIVIAATNRPDVLDPALLRPGRFDRRIVVPMPDINGREAILKIHSRKVPMAANVNLQVIARGTPGFSGADLANLINEATLLAARHDQNKVTMHDLDMAKDKVILGAERRSMFMSDDEKELSAYHESGHALVATLVPASDAVHRATIIPRGQSLGSVLRLPEKDKLMVRIDQLKADIAVAMGGRVAEEIIFGEGKISTGASSDIRMATMLARRMVTEWGMSEKLGTVRHSGSDDEVFLGHSLVQSKAMSDQTAAAIDDEVKSLVDEGKNKAKMLLEKNLKKLHLLAKNLIKYETLTGEEVREIVSKGAFTHDTDLPTEVASSDSLPI